MPNYFLDGGVGELKKLQEIIIKKDLTVIGADRIKDRISELESLNNE